MGGVKWSHVDLQGCAGNLHASCGDGDLERRRGRVQADVGRRQQVARDAAVEICVEGIDGEEDRLGTWLAESETRITFRWITGWDIRKWVLLTAHRVSHEEEWQDHLLAGRFRDQSFEHVGYVFQHARRRPGETTLVF